MCAEPTTGKPARPIQALMVWPWDAIIILLPKGPCLWAGRVCLASNLCSILLATASRLRCKHSWFLEVCGFVCLCDAFLVIQTSVKPQTVSVATKPLLLSVHVCELLLAMSDPWITLEGVRCVYNPRLLGKRAQLTACLYSCL